MSSQRARIAIAILVVAAMTVIILDLRGGAGPFATEMLCLMGGAWAEEARQQQAADGDSSDDE